MVISYTVEYDNFLFHCHLLILKNVIMENKDGYYNWRNINNYCSNHVSKKSQKIFG